MQSQASVRRNSPTLPVAVLSGPPLIGSLRWFQRDRLGLFAELAARGPVTRFRLGPMEVHMISEPSLAEEVLVGQAEAFRKGRELGQFLRPLLGDGLLTVEEPAHRTQRKRMAAAFAPKRMAAYASAMADEARRTVGSWRDGSVVDVSAAMMEMTLATAGRTLFAADIRGDAAVVGAAFTEAMEAMLDRMGSPLQLPYAVPLPAHRRMRRAVAALDRVVYRIIAERRAAGGDRGDVLSALLAARDEDGSAMTDRQVRDEVMTLLLAGHETTANALTWALHALGRDAAVRDRVSVEADSLGGRPPTPGDLAGLPYGLMVLEEAMRLWPPAYVLGRQAIRDVAIGPYRLAAGAAVMVNTWGLHRRADLYPEPATFRPERFSAVARQGRPRGAYLPFGGGPRVCIGAHFALVEAQIALATIAGAVELTPVSGRTVEPEPLVTLRPRGGLPMRVTRRA
jgi:cytochrome P450